MRPISKWLAAVALFGCCCTACSRGGVQFKAIHGTVTCGQNKVDSGRLRFVPIEDTRGPASQAKITDGAYRVEARGGLPLGRHRVEVDARKATGRMIPDPTGDGLIAETIRISPDRYASPNSPLTIEVTADSSGRIDIEVPNE